MKRAVITGLGALTPIGNNIETFWENALAGKSGAGSVTSFSPNPFSSDVVCEIKELNLSDHFSTKEFRTIDLFCQYALIAANEAMQNASLNLESLDPFDLGVIVGTGQGGMNTFESEVSAYTKHETSRYSPYFVPKIISNMVSGLIAMRYGFMGVNYTPVSACATGNTALMDALNCIRMGKAKVIIAGSAEAPITPSSIGGFSSMKAMSKLNIDPQSASKPFDAERDGFVMGEGAGILIVEEMEHAKSRGATIYAELVGAAMTSDAYHMTATHPEGLGAIGAMSLALKDAHLTPDKVDYLNAHATSTPVGDLSEIKAITQVFKGENNLSISATKSMTGHLLGAAASIEAILSILSIKDQIIPTTINTTQLDKEIPDHLDIVLKEGKEKTVKVAMSNAFGFGGHNSSVIFRDYR